jgi:uncharacterized protein
MKTPGGDGGAGKGFSRRGFLLAAGGVVAGLGGVGADAFLGAPGRVQLTQEDVALPELPAELAGLTVAHLTDVHLYDGLHTAARHSMEIVQRTQPDITIITGDMMENPDQLGNCGEFVRGCRGGLATVVTMGNWEHGIGITPDDMEKMCSAAGATFLFNESLTVESGGRKVALVGLDDPWMGEPDPAKALREVPADALTIWGYHAPGYADKLKEEAFPKPAMMLTGHTHGGQIRLPLIPAITPVGSGRFVAGWYHDSFAPLFVSRGVGTVDIRARFRCPPEVGVFRLVSS